MAVFELVDGAEAVVTAEGMSVYYGVDGVLRAVAEVVDVERLLSA